MGLGLALSSTAIVLPLLGERDLLTTPAGRDAFAVLLFQDLAFIPLVALVPLLASGHAMPADLPWLQVGKGLAAIALILGGGRYPDAAVVPRDRRRAARRSCSPPPRC